MHFAGAKAACRKEQTQIVLPCRPDSCILPAGGFMNERENVALVRKLYDAFARGDIETTGAR
jgi:hypothetical protein